jgi:hypothetical protein
LENVAAQKKARLELNSGKKVLIAKAKNIGHKETIPAKLSNCAQRQPSIKVVENADEVRSWQRIPPNNPNNILESDDDEPDGMAISSKGSNINKRHILSEIKNKNQPPLLNTEDDEDNKENVEDIEIIESPAESADTELHEL